MKSRSLPYIFSAALAVNLSATETTVDFRNPGAVLPFTISASGATLEMSGGARLYRPDPAAADKYRYYGLHATETLSGDFDVEFGFVIKHLDHFNGLRLMVTSVTKDWAASLHRRHYNAGQQQLVLDVTLGGVKQPLRIIAETARAGTLKLARRDDKLHAFFKPEGGDWKPVGEPVAIKPGEARAALELYSPPQTNATIELTNYRHLAAKKQMPAAWTYAPPRRVATLENGLIRQLVPPRTGNADVSPTSVARDGLLVLKPGERAVFFCKGPLNLRGPRLEWQSSGALKLSAVQMSTDETLELGETLLWDNAGKQNAPPNASPAPPASPADPAPLTPLASRSFLLSDFILRYPGQRRWRQTDYTHDNLLVFTFTPSGDEPVALADVALSGSTLQWLAPDTPASPATSASSAAAAKTRIRTEDDFILLGWEPPESGRRDFGKLPVSGNTSTRWCGIPFLPSTTILDEKLPSLEIPLAAGRRAGRFHFAHAAGPQAKDAPWTVATYTIAYEDGTCERVFATLQWNVSTCASDYGPDAGASVRTWWGPASVGHARLQFVPKGNGVYWNSFYVASVLNPYPEKHVTRIIVSLPPLPPLQSPGDTPGDTRQFAVLGITLTPPEKTVIGLVEPDRAVLAHGEKTGANVYLYNNFSKEPEPESEPDPDPDAPAALFLRKPAAEEQLATITLARSGRFACGRAEFTPPAGTEWIGPARLVCGSAQSSLLGVMPPPPPPRIAGGCAVAHAIHDDCRRRGTARRI
ncbi:MAG: hypothetical protein LBK99_26695 [Opitutaceae bacterium]|jgi:hypothetical protein|nr:hypothetical protein [Opitutaceae bacterium]